MSLAQSNIRDVTLRHLSTKGQLDQSYMSVTTTLQDYLHLSKVLTLYDAGLRQGSLHGRRLGFCLRGGSGLLSGRRGFLSSTVVDTSSSQVKSVDFLYSTRADGQPSTTTKSNVLLGKDQHLQAQPDYRHGWGAEDTGDINQPSLSGHLLLGLSSRCLLSNSSGRCSTLLSNKGLARQLRQEFIYGGGWASAGSSWLSHYVPIAFVTLLYGVGRRHLLQVREFRRQYTTSRHKYSTTLFKTAYLLGRGLRDLQLLGHTLAVHVPRPP
jgi:hypothetical protein